MGDLNYKTDPETVNKIFIDLLTEVLSNQHIILDRLAIYDSISTGKPKDEMMECYQNARDIGRRIVKEHLFEAYGPDLTEELGL